MIITRTRPAVKPTRNAPRPNRPFAEGIFPARQPRRMPYTSADLAWAAENFNQDAADYDSVPSDADLEFAAGCALAQARMDAGYSIL